MTTHHPKPEGHVLVIGSSGTDIVGRANAPLQGGTSNPANLRMSLGGVARNVAENLARLGVKVVLITSVGDDYYGHHLLEHANSVGINTEHCMIVPEQSTGSYVAVLDEHGSLNLGLDDMRVMQAITPAYLRKCRDLFKSARVVFIDANLPEPAIKTVASITRRLKIPLAADPTSVSLAPALAPYLKDLWLITPNEAEANVLCHHPVPHADPNQAIEAAQHLVEQGVDRAIITMAEFGLGYATSITNGHIPAIKTEIQDPTGAGDALTAAVIFALLNDISIDEAVQLGISAASLTLRTKGTVDENLSVEKLYDQLL